MKTNIDFLKIRSDDFQNEFERIATALCYDHILCVNEQRFFIVDVEFYYYSEKHHPDPFVYSGTDRNQRMGEWFFHYSGIDITFGEGGTRGGILIRALRNLESSRYIIGTLKSMYEVLNCFPTINSGEGLSLRLERNPDPKNGELMKGVRIGLDSYKKKKDPDRYQDKQYRFTADYEIIADFIKRKELNVSSLMKKNYGVQ